MALDWCAIGGWSRSAKTVFARESGRFALCLIDTNGDGLHLSLDKLEWASGSWQVTSTDDDVTSSGGSGGTPRFVYIWGAGRRGELVGVSYRGVAYTAPVVADGWWAFIAPTDPAAGDGITPVLT